MNLLKIVTEYEHTNTILLWTMFIIAIVLLLQVTLLLAEWLRQQAEKQSALQKGWFYKCSNITLSRNKTSRLKRLFIRYREVAALVIAAIFIITALILFFNL